MIHQEKIAVIQACIDRKPIQSRQLGCFPSVWVDDPSPTFDFCHREYRVKPMAREFWVNVKPGEVYCAYLSSKHAYAVRPLDCIATIRVREVLDADNQEGG